MKYIRIVYHVLRNLLKVLVAPVDFRIARAKLLSDSSIPDHEKALVERVLTPVHRKDGMYIPFEAGHYLSVGLSALRCVERALAETPGTVSPASILDFPSGYGRVLRFLRVRFPGSRITASEIEQEALDFCRREFSAETLLSETDFGRISAPTKFDLIWCGSLLTHIDGPATISLLRFFHDHLSPGGVCLFTAHGQHSIAMLEANMETYGLTADARKKLLSEYRISGYGYADYKNYARYGISAVSRQRMVEMAQSVGAWKETSFIARGWDNHHDVYGFTL